MHLEIGIDRTQIAELEKEITRGTGILGKMTQNLKLLIRKDSGKRMIEEKKGTVKDQKAGVKIIAGEVKAGIGILPMIVEAEMKGIAKTIRGIRIIDPKEGTAVVITKEIPKRKEGENMTGVIAEADLVLIIGGTLKRRNLNQE